MKIAVFDSHNYEKKSLMEQAQIFGFELVFFENRLTAQVAHLARGYEVILCFVNDDLSSPVVKVLHEGGTRFVALRCAGFNNVDLKACKEIGLRVSRVPEYSPAAVAEHAVGLILTLNRHIHRAYQRVRDGNFSIEGFVGFDLKGKTIGVIGTGKIGEVFCEIMLGFGCRVFAADLSPKKSLMDRGVVYTTLDHLFRESDIISLHVPLTPQTRHLINRESFAKCKKGVMLINTSRGGLIETPALIKALKSGFLGSAGLDVYEEEQGIFFHDLSEDILQDDDLARLLTFPNVLITSHQAFLTKEALENIAEATMKSISHYMSKSKVDYEILS